MHRFIIGLGAAFLTAAVLMPAQAATTVKSSSADAQFKALYTKEWKWREEQFPGGEDDSHKGIVDHLPKVDPATQDMRQHYWEEVLKQAKAMRLVTAALGGKGGGDMNGLADHLLVVPSDTTARIQEMHITLGQMLCGALEIQLGLVPPG